MCLCIMSIINNWMVTGRKVSEQIFYTSSHLFNKSKNILRSTTTIWQFTLKFKKILKVPETSYVNNNSTRLHGGICSSGDVTNVQLRACGRYCPSPSEEHLLLHLGVLWPPEGHRTENPFLPPLSEDRSTSYLCLTHLWGVYWHE